MKALSTLELISFSIVFIGRRWDLNETGIAPPARISSVITAQSGDTAFLPCHVPLREEHGVSFNLIIKVSKCF